MRCNKDNKAAGLNLSDPLRQSHTIHIRLQIDIKEKSLLFPCWNNRL